MSSLLITQKTTGETPVPPVQGVSTSRGTQIRFRWPDSVGIFAPPEPEVGEELEDDESHEQADVKCGFNDLIDLLPHLLSKFIII